jgi:protein-disulfide isomerase
VAPSITTPSDIPSSGRTLGDPAAPVTVDVWSDYQCPQCRQFATEVLPELLGKGVRVGLVKIVYHDLIVVDTYAGSHDSVDAANAARCAADQGKFWTYQDWLWANQGPEGSGAFNAARLVEIGLRAGLDTSAFRTCVENGSHAADVQAESASANAKGINAAPKILVNGHVTAGWDYDTLATAIDSSLPVSTQTPATSASPLSAQTPASAPSTTAAATPLSSPWPSNSLLSSGSPLSSPWPSATGSP